MLSLGYLRPLRFLFGRRKDYPNHFPNPQDSTGIHLAMLGRNRSCWEAVGKARTDFKILQGEIGNYIQQTSESLSQDVVWSLYMVGRTRETSAPVVTFISSEPGPRKRLRSLVKESKILERYPGFSTMDIDRPPGHRSGVMRTCSGGRLDELYDSFQRPSTTQPLFFNSSNNCMGTRLLLPIEGSTDPRVATGGGLVRHGNRIFMMSVAHPFEMHWHDRFSQTAPRGEYVFDIDTISDYEEDKNITSPIIYGGAISNSIPSNESDEWSTEETTSERRFARDERTFQLGGPIISSTNGGTPALDYSLFELTDSIVRPLGPTTRTSLLGNPKTFSREPRATNIVIHTVSGSKVGRLLATPSFMQPTDGFLRQQVWTVMIEGSLEEGICGSWVTDVSGLEVFGHVIAGAPEDGFAYIIPFYEILDDLDIHFGKGWGLAKLDDDLETTFHFTTNWLGWVFGIYLALCVAFVVWVRSFWTSINPETFTALAIGIPSLVLSVVAAFSAVIVFGKNSL